MDNKAIVNWEQNVIQWICINAIIKKKKKKLTINDKIFIYHMCGRCIFCKNKERVPLGIFIDL